jgi:hypothetical protein
MLAQTPSPAGVPNFTGQWGFVGYLTATTCAKTSQIPQVLNPAFYVIQGGLQGREVAAVGYPFGNAITLDPLAGSLTPAGDGFELDQDLYQVNDGGLVSGGQNQRLKASGFLPAQGATPPTFANVVFSTLLAPSPGYACNAVYTGTALRGN